MHTSEKRHRFRREFSSTGSNAKRFGLFLKEARQRAGIEVSELARLLGLTPDYIYKIERGYSPIPATERLYQIAAAIGMPREEILAAADRLDPELGEFLRANQFEVLAIIKMLRGYPPSALQYVKERIPLIIEEIEEIA